PTTVGALVSYQFGANGDIPVPGNYDGDRKTDMALFRTWNSTWYVLPSTTGQWIAEAFGTQGDFPVSNRVVAVTISGQVTAGGGGLPGVTITLSGSASGSATTDGNGNYSFVVSVGGNYEITPTSAGVLFIPASASFNSVTANQIANFDTAPSIPGDGSGSDIPSIPGSFTAAAPTPACHDISGTWN